MQLTAVIFDWAESVPRRMESLRAHARQIRLMAGPLLSMVRIGDTPTDVEEGLNAGMWTIGVIRTGNEVGLTEAEWEARDGVLWTELLASARQRLTEASRHYVMKSAAETLEVLTEINGRIRAGKRP